MRVRTFSLNPIPENHAMSFASITSDIEMLQELNYRRDTNPLPYMIAFITILMGLTIIGASMVANEWLILLLPAGIIAGCIVAFIWIFNAIDNGVRSDSTGSITIIIDG